MSKSNIFIPNKIKVGYVKRCDTYTEKLAYVIYYDQKNVLRKEKSWEGWRDKKLTPNDFDNEPTSGFVLNKKAGGYNTGWNNRQTYCRVYDPRGFEFEITIPNLLYILENSNSIKGKGLEGEFVYGWDGTELLLVPVDSPDYKELTKYADTLFNATPIKGKELILGAKYMTAQNDTLIYLGRFDEYSPNSNAKNKGKKYWFLDKKWSDNVITMASITGKIVKLIDEIPVSNYANVMDKLMKDPRYNPLDPTKYVYKPYTEEEFVGMLKNRSNHFDDFYSNIEGQWFCYSIEEWRYIEVFRMIQYKDGNDYYYKDSSCRMFIGDLTEESYRKIFNQFNPHKQIRYQRDGRKYKE